jgi:predicted secreted protein with PEFG-CTERM motif
MKTISSLFVLFAIVAGLVAITPAAFADHSEVTITPAPGSGTPGCEETAEGCYIPKEATVDVGGKVIFSNTDSAAHTFTAGTAAEGPSGEFDTSLVIAGSSYEWTPTTVGEFPYYCMVHPWMEGLIVVQEAGTEAEHDGEEHTGEEVHTEDATATGMLSDGTKVSIMTSAPTSGEKMEITVDFEDSEHANYDIMVTQNGAEVLNDIAAHGHEGEGMHETAPLSSSDPVEITITFQGYGVNDPKTGPIGEQVVFSNIVPEFGTVAMMILAVSIISIVAVTAKTKVIPRF